MLVSESSAMHQLRRRSAQKPQPDLQNGTGSRKFGPVQDRHPRPRFYCVALSEFSRQSQNPHSSDGSTIVSRSLLVSRVPKRNGLCLLIGTVLHDLSDGRGGGGELVIVELNRLQDLGVYFVFNGLSCSPDGIFDRQR